MRHRIAQSIASCTRRFPSDSNETELSGFRQTILCYGAHAGFVLDARVQTIYGLFKAEIIHLRGPPRRCGGGRVIYVAVPV